MVHWRGNQFRSGDRLTPVLSIVPCAEESRRSVAARVIDLVTSRVSGIGAENVDLQSSASPLFGGNGYLHGWHQAVPVRFQ